MMDSTPLSVHDPLTPSELVLLGKFHTAAECTAAGDPEPPWLVRPFLASGAITSFSGQPKEAGKTTFLLHLVRAVLNGEPFLGEPVTHSAAAVVYASEESATTLNIALRHAGVAGQSNLHIVKHSDLAGLPLYRVAALLAEMRKAVSARLIVIDTFPQFAGFAEGQEQDSGAMISAMLSIRFLANTGAAVALITHDRKGGSGRATRSTRGSNALPAAADQLVKIDSYGKDPNSPIRQLAISGRLSAAIHQYVELTDGGYVLVGKPAGSTRAGNKAAAPGWKLPPSAETAWTPAEFQTKNRLPSERTAQRRLDALFKSGDVLTIGAGKKGDPVRYFRSNASTARQAA